jgi:hypothetical protein
LLLHLREALMAIDAMMAFWSEPARRGSPLLLTVVRSTLRASMS